MKIKENLTYTLWSTSITRFNSAKRLKSWKHCIGISLLFLSIYLTTLSVLIYAEKISSNYEDISQFISIFISITILCLNLLINTSSLDTKAFNHHECGRKIKALLNELPFIDSNKELQLIYEEYDKILDKYENHNSLDYYMFLIEHKNKISGDKIETRKINYFFCFYIYIFRYIPQLIVYISTVILPMLIIFHIVDFKLT